MPQVIPAIVAAAQAAYSAAVTLIATPLVGVLGEGGAVLVAQQTVNFAINAAVALTASIAFRPNVPDPEFAKTNRKQAIPDRMSGYGTVRVGGAFMLWEAVGEYAYIVLAQLDGLSDGVEATYLNDDTVTVTGGWVQVGPDLRYGKNSDRVQIDYRNGLPTETHYSQIPPSVWPANARGDGIASLMMICKVSNLENFVRDFPNGLPVASSVRRAQLCWDPRLGARGTITSDADKLASATWGFTKNPVLHLLDYKTAGSGGPGYPIEKFLPRIADWITAANVCDEAVALKAGGTEPRYRAGFTYLHSTADADVTASLLSAFDGFLAQDIDGNFTVQAGKYYAPTVTIPASSIVGMYVKHGKPDEEATNVVVVSFTDPAFNYTEVETTPLRDQANIDLIGVERVQRLALTPVQSSAQAQRLRKIALNRATQAISGTIVTTLDGLRAWGERRIRIQADPNESEVMADIVVEIQPITLNADFTVTIPFVSCDSLAYDWDAATEEGDGAGDDVRPPPVALATPVITNVEPFLASAGDTAATRLRVTMGAETRSDLSYVIRWRPTGATEWVVDAQREPNRTSGFPVVETGFVTSQNLDVQAQAITGGGVSSEWSATYLTTAVPTPTTSLLVDQAGNILQTQGGDYLVTEI